MNRKRLLVSLLTAAVACVLLSHRSTKPLILNYSLPYFLFLVFSAIAAVGVVALFARLKSRAWFLIVAVVAPLVTIAGVLEGAGQAYAWLYPSYDVLYLQPDRSIGWKQVPNLRYTWAGSSWAAHDFSVPIEINSEGFRDREHVIEKSSGTFRLAMLGDSFIEALQVPLEQTAGGLLESRLNSNSTVNGNRRFEVLNFGISNFGVGQYLLTWESYSRKYSPDYVFVFVAGFHMRRAVTEYTSGDQGRKKLALNPIFHLIDDHLIRQPAKDFDKFIEAQQELIETQFGGQRIQKRKLGLFLWKILDRICGPIAAWQRTMAAEIPKPRRELTPQDIAVNLRILRELGASTQQAGSRLIVVDTIRYFGDDQELSVKLRNLCIENDIGYLELSSSLFEKVRDGGTLTWRYDGHFNRVGHEIFADAMYNWLVQKELGGQSDGS